MDRLRNKVRELGYLSDGSFSGSIAKIPSKALVDLIDELLSNESRSTTMDILHGSGLPDNSFKGFVISALRKVGNRVAAEAGEEIAGNFGDLIDKIFNSSNIDEIVLALREE
ncbi:MAG: hypothetical protein GQ529_09020 [Methyloprofundus sp.]|nr:hypothetical protein [Methyloprofundus sp.]